MKIIIDADACPKRVLEICQRVGHTHGLQVWTVASFNHNIQSEHHIVVGNAPQEADMKLVNISLAGDVAVTQDWGLAAMLLGRGVICLSPTGKEYRNENIDFLLEERNVKARHRKGGGRTRGPKKRSPIEDARFEATLKRVLSSGGLS